MCWASSLVSFSPGFPTCRNGGSRVCHRTVVRFRSRRCQCGRAPPFPPLTHTCLLHFTAPAATYLCSHKIMFPRCQTPDGQSFCLGGRLARRVTAKSVQRGLRPSPGKTSEKEEIQHPAQHQLGRVIIVIHKARSVLYMCDLNSGTCFRVICPPSKFIC